MLTAAWVLAIMLDGQPAKTPWSHTYVSTAQAIAEAASSDPLFEGEDGAAKTAAVMVGVAIMESALRPDAVGDNGTSFCLFQVNQSNFKTLGVTRAQVQKDPKACSFAALRMMHSSFRICRALPVLQRLGWYAAGREGCAGTKASERRVGLGMKLFERRRPPSSAWEAAALDLAP